MIKVTETKKLTKLDFNGKEITVNSEDTIVWTQIKVETDEDELIVNEGDTVQFITDGGELKKGMTTKLSGKKEKAEITIAFDDGHKETWSVCSIKEGTLKVIETVEKDTKDMEDEE